MSVCCQQVANGWFFGDPGRELSSIAAAATAGGGDGGVDGSGGGGAAEMTRTSTVALSAVATIAPLHKQ